MKLFVEHVYVIVAADSLKGAATRVDLLWRQVFQPRNKLIVLPFNSVTEVAPPTAPAMQTTTQHSAEATPSGDAQSHQQPTPRSEAGVEATLGLTRQRTYFNDDLKRWITNQHDLDFGVDFERGRAPKFWYTQLIAKGIEEGIFSADNTPEDALSYMNRVFGCSLRQAERKQFREEKGELDKKKTTLREQPLPTTPAVDAAPCLHSLLRPAPPMEPAADAGS